MEKMKSRDIRFLLAISLVFLFWLPAKAAEFPTKPITLIITFTTGGAIDITSRALANAAKKYLGQPIICENIPGGGGTVGVTLALKKPPDGYTLVIPPTNSLHINWHMREMNFHPVNDLTHIIRVSGVLNGLVVRADSEWQNMQEFIQYARQNPDKISYGTGGIGVPPHLAMEELAILAGGIRWIHVPYKGGGETNTALLGGHVDAVAGSSAWAPLVDAGKFRLLAVFPPYRSTRYPVVPTLKELGYDMACSSPLDILGPKGLSKDIIKKIHDAFKKALDDPEYQAVHKKFDMFPVYLGAEDLEKSSEQEFKHIGTIITKLGLQRER